MNIGFGATELWKEQEVGTFFCPVCGSERRYVHRQSRTWIRVVVPLIPRDVLENVFECQTCHRRFDEHALTTGPTSDIATRLQRITRSASVLLMLNGDPHNEAARKKAVDVVQASGMRHYSETDLDADLRSIDVSNLDEEAEAIIIGLDIAGRERLLLDVGHVGIAAGELTDASRSTLDQLGRSLTLSPGSVHRILAQLSHEATAIGAFAAHDDQNT